MIEQRLILVNLLVRLGMAAALSSTPLRSLEFKKVLFREDRTTRQKVYLALWFAIPMFFAVWFRFIAPSFPLDMSFETTLLLGVIGGRLSGVAGGVLMAVPALWHGEWATLPFNIICGFVAGQLRTLAAEKDDVWSFSPFIDLSIYRWIRRNFPKPRLFDWQITFFVTIVALRFLQTQVTDFFPSSMFRLESPTNLWVEAAIYATAITAIGIELKIFNGVRIQIKLEEQERLLLHARMEALQNQINPHFLFNTLNSVSSLVRFDPDTARELIIKLATILRRLLSTTESFVPLREEVEFIDNYLDIEVVRFGRDKLRVVKELDHSSLDLLVPSMLLQPLVENSIKHGLASKVEGGSIFLRSRLTSKYVIIEVEDDGVGMGGGKAAGGAKEDGDEDEPVRTGIGMANIAERLKVLYGDAARMKVESQPGKGTTVRMRLPILNEDSAVPAVLYERSSTRR